MNVEAARELIAYLENLPPERFDMLDWIKSSAGKMLRGLAPAQEWPCGTIACIAGHGALLWGKPEDVYPDDFCAAKLGLSSAQSTALFYKFPLDLRHDLPAAIQRIKDMFGISDEVPA